MAGEGSVFRRCGCTDPVTGRQYGRACLRLAAGAVTGAGMCDWNCLPGWTGTGRGSGGAATRRVGRLWRCWPPIRAAAAIAVLRW